MGPAFIRKYNTLLVSGTTSLQFPIIKRGSVDFAVGADWIPVAGDVKISKDGGAAANVTNLPTAVVMGNTAYWDLVLTAAELSCQQAVITISDSSVKAVEDQCILVETYGHASAAHLVDFDDGVRFGLSSLPNAAAGANGGLPTADANNTVKADLSKILATSLTETAGQLAAGFKKFFDVPTPIGTLNLLDVAVSTRLATSGYTAPDNASITTLLSRADVTTSSRLAAASYVAPDNAGIGSAASSASTAAAQSTTAATNSITILNRLGAFTGAGLNTVLGFLRALLRKDAALTPSDVGGTYDNTTDSLEAQQEASVAQSVVLSSVDSAVTTINTNTSGLAAAIAAETVLVTAIKAVTDKLDPMLVLNVSVYRWTANALSLAPTGGGGGGGPIGAGADLMTVVIQHPTTNTPIADADVWLSSDPSGVTVVAGTLQTNANGEVQFMIDDGATYYLWMQKDGENSIIGQQFTAVKD